MSDSQNTVYVPNKQTRRLQIGRFLRECRERISPEALGLPATGRRRTPGLRREEVAMLAGISPTYYTKIEQGRVDVSDRALDRIASVLQLNHTERNYVFSLAAGRSVQEPQPQEEHVGPILQRLLDIYEPYPAHILGRRWDILAWNQAYCAAIVDIEQIPPQARNLVILISFDGAAQRVVVNWEEQFRRIIAQFRADYGKYHNDPWYAELIANLVHNSPLFNKWWTEFLDVGGPSDIEMLIDHPTAGRLNLLEVALIANDHPGMRIVYFLPQDEQTKQKLHQLHAERTTQKHH